MNYSSKSSDSLEIYKVCASRNELQPVQPLLPTGENEGDRNG